MKIGFFAGSFDPFTIGHFHVAKQALEVFDKLVVGIGINESKTRRFDKLKMKDAIEKLFASKNLNNVEVVIYDGLTVDTAKKFNATFLVRGLRDSADFEAEEKLAVANKQLSGLETIYFRTGDYGYVSSSLIYDLFTKNEDVSNYVPEFVIDVLKQKTP